MDARTVGAGILLGKMLESQMFVLCTVVTHRQDGASRATLAVDADEPTWNCPLHSSAKDGTHTI